MALRDLLRGILNSRVPNPEAELAAAIGSGFEITYGQWVPTVGGQTSAGVGTYTQQWGQYALFGDIIVAQFRVSGSAHTGTGQAYVTLPFAVSSASAPAGYFSGALFSNTAATLTLATPNTSRTHMYTANPGAVFNIPVGTFDYLASLVYLR